MVNETSSDFPQPAGHFFSLTPERVLEAVEQSGRRTTGLCYALNSLENRVYEVELEEGDRVVGKFYRPGRWEEETILDEHRLLLTLDDVEVPVCAPLPFDDGTTLRRTPEGIFFALFPRTGGRAPEELTVDEYEQLGRYLARIHNAAASLELGHRPELSPTTYGARCLEVILEHGGLSGSQQQRYRDVVTALVEIGERRWPSGPHHAVHADCHRGNLLRGSDGWFFLDFDDMARAPAVQDFWLLLPARPTDCPEQLEAMLTGYEQFRELDRSTLRLIEVLRGLRYVRYAAWVARRWQDPSFPRAFPEWGTERYWEEQIADVREQVDRLAGEDLRFGF